jgi:hypothetical protein
MNRPGARLEDDAAAKAWLATTGQAWKLSFFVVAFALSACGFALHFVLLWAGWASDDVQGIVAAAATVVGIGSILFLSSIRRRVCGARPVWILATSGNQSPCFARLVTARVCPMCAGSGERSPVQEPTFDPSAFARMHGFLDYAVAALLFSSPALFDLNRPASAFAYGTAALELAVAALTDSPFGAVKVISPKTHLMIELLVSLSLMFLPLMLVALADVGDRGREVLIRVGVAVFLLCVATPYARRRD